MALGRKTQRPGGSRSRGGGWPVFYWPSPQGWFLAELPRRKEPLCTLARNVSRWCTSTPSDREEKSVAHNGKGLPPSPMRTPPLRPLHDACTIGNFRNVYVVPIVEQRMVGIFRVSSIFSDSGRTWCRSSFDFFRDSHKGRTFLINFLSYFAPRHLNLIFVNCLFYLDVGFVNRYMESVFPESQEDSGKWNCFLDSVHSWCVYLLQIYLAK